MRARDFRQTARDALKGHWFVAVIAGIIASLLGGLNNYGMSFSFNFSLPEPDTNEGVTSMISSVQSSVGAGLYDGIILFLMIVTGIIFVYSLIMFIIGSAVGIGYAEFNLDIIDGAKPRIGSLFSRFGQIKTAICANLLVIFRVMIGLIFFIIPGIVMSYSYAMVNFVMAENPDMNAREALKESKRIMKGNRWRLFCLGLSFIGWALLSMLTFGIGLLWFIPYQQASIAAFYREVSDRADYSIR